MITFHGFLKAYVEGTDEGAAKDDQETRLPALAEGDPVSAASLSANGHETKPPSRYTEATLIKELEDRQIGRPSTYASIIGTILNRGYVYKKGTALVPAWIAFSVVRLLEEHFTRLIDYDFTALMETVLDDIARGEKDRVTELHEFYYGSERLAGVKPLVDGLGDIDAKALATFPMGDPAEGIDLRVGQVRPLPRGPGRRRGAGRQAGQRARGPAAGRADPRRRPRSCWPTRPARRSSSAPTRTPGCGSWPRTAASVPTSPRSSPEDAPKSAKAAHRLALQVDVARHRHPGRRGEAAVAAAGGRRGRATARRSPPRTAATGRT